MAERRFPIQSDVMVPRSGGRRDVPATTVPWSEAEIAWQTNDALGHGDQSLETLARRGGFGRCEFAILRAGFDFHHPHKLVLEHPPVTETEAPAQGREYLGGHDPDYG